MFLLSFLRLQIYEAIAAIFWQSASYVIPFWSVKTTHLILSIFVKSLNCLQIADLIDQEASLRVAAEKSEKDKQEMKKQLEKAKRDVEDSYFNVNKVRFLNFCSWFARWSRLLRVLWTRKHFVTDLKKVKETSALVNIFGALTKFCSFKLASFIFRRSNFFK